MAGKNLHLLSIFICCQIVLVSSGGYGAIRLVNYTNPSFKISTGRCCDRFLTINCKPSVCDPLFQICIDTRPASVLKPCALGRFNSESYDNHDLVTFGPKLSGILANPFNFTFSEWEPKKTLSLTIQAFDHDRNGADKLMSVFTLIIPTSANDNGHLHFIQKELVNDRSRLNIEYGLTCNSGYYGNCTEHHPRPTTQTMRMDTTTQQALTSTVVHSSSSIQTTHETTTEKLTTKMLEQSTETFSFNTATTSHQADVTSKASTTNYHVVGTSLTSSNPVVTSFSGAISSVLFTSTKQGLSALEPRKLNQTQKSLSSESKSGNGAVIGGAVGGLLALVAVLFIIGFLLYRQKKMRKVQDKEVIEEEKQQNLETAADNSKIAIQSADPGTDSVEEQTQIL